MERSCAPGFEFESFFTRTLRLNSRNESADSTLPQGCLGLGVGCLSVDEAGRMCKTSCRSGLGTPTAAACSTGVGSRTRGTKRRSGNWQPQSRISANAPVALGDIQSTGGQFGLEIFRRSNNTRGQLPSRGTSMPPLARDFPQHTPRPGNSGSATWIPPNGVF